MKWNGRVNVEPRKPAAIKRNTTKQYNDEKCAIMKMPRCDAIILMRKYHIIMIISHKLLLQNSVGGKEFRFLAWWNGEKRKICFSLFPLRFCILSRSRNISSALSSSGKEPQCTKNQKIRTHKMEINNLNFCSYFFPLIQIARF